MCVGDWRLGRLIRSQTFDWDTNVLSPQPIAANPNRVGLSVSGHTLSSTVTAGHRLRSEGKVIRYLLATTSFYHLSLWEHGDIVTKAFDIAVSTTVAVGTWTEYWLPEEVLQAGIEEFKRTYPGLIR